MALDETQQAAVDSFRPLVGAWTGDDESLHDYLLAAGGDVNAAAAAVWTAKASSAADLIDVKEGSTSRPLSQLRASYLAMAASYQERADATTTPATGYTRLRRLVRG